MTASILVVEDNADNLKLITWVLEDESYKVTGVESAEAALEIVEEESFDLVLMDIDLPGIDGEEATRRLRADTRFNSFPIVALTAHALKDEIERIKSAGFTALATKPIDENQILEMIANLLDEANG